MPSNRNAQRHAQPTLSILAGPDALAELRDGGLRPERICCFVGASGGPKWLVLHGLDRVLFPWLTARVQAPLHVVDSSIGRGYEALDESDAGSTREPRDARRLTATALIARRHVDTGAARTAAWPPDPCSP